MTTDGDTAGADIQGYIKFGDYCVFRENSTRCFMTCPLTSSQQSMLVVPDGRKGDAAASGGSLPGISIQACQFQIVAEEKSKWCTSLDRSVTRLQRKKTRQRDVTLANARMAAAKKNASKFEDQLAPLRIPTAPQATTRFANQTKIPETESLPSEILPALPFDDLLDDEALSKEREMAMAEMQDNDLTQARQFGFPLHYGDIIQLWHPYTRKFVRTSSSAVAMLEPSNMQVTLDSRGGGACHFRIMPRYKIRSVGDIVSSSDEIVIESVKSQSQMLCISNDVLPCTEESTDADGSPSLFPLPHCHEVSLSVNRSSFEISLFNRPSAYTMRQYGATKERLLAPAPPISKYYDDTSKETSLAAGMAIQLFHKDSDSYFAAEGHIVNWFQNSKKARLSLDVHLRNRSYDPERPSRKRPPTSAVTWFEIEHCKGPHVGGKILWDTPVRLKHVPTQLYICSETIEVSDEVDTVGMTLKSLTEILAMCESGPDPSSFHLLSEIGVTKEVPVDAFLRLRHEALGFWVHAGNSHKSQAVPRPHVDRATFSDADEMATSFAKSASTLQWDEASLYRFTLTRFRSTPDAFSVRKCPDELVYYVNTIAGYIPMFNRYAALRRRRELSTSEAETFAIELNELDSFMYNRGIEQKKRQKQLRSLQVIEALVEILKAPFQISSTSEPTTSHLLQSYNEISDSKHHNTQIVMTNVFRLLRSYLRGSARKNEMYMAEHIPFLWNLFGTNMKVEPMFNEMIQDNQMLVNIFGRVEVKRVVELLRGGDRNADYLQLFSALCVCEEEPNRHMQELIGAELLNCAEPPVLLTHIANKATKKSDPSVFTIFVRRNESDAGTDLNSFVFSALDEDSETSSPEFLFLQRQLELYSNLCLGRMEQNIELIVNTHKHLTWDECFLCATANSALDSDGKTKTEGDSNLLLPRSLRRIYVNLIVNLFVDVGSNRDVCTGATYSYNYNELSRSYYKEAAQNQTMSLSGAEFPRFQIVKEWILRYLLGVSCMIHKDQFEGQPENRLLSSILNLLRYLIKFGYYVDENDILALVKPLSSVLSGLNDFNVASDAQPENAKFARRWRASKRFEMDDDALAVVTAKLQALSCIDHLFDYVGNIRLRFFLADYKTAVDSRYANTRRRTSMVDGHSLSAIGKILAIRDKYVEKVGGIDKVDFNKLLGSSYDELVNCHKEILHYLSCITQHCDFVTAGWTIYDSHYGSVGNPTLVEILLDTAKYDYYPLLNRSLQLIEKIYSAETDLVQCAIKANIAFVEDSVLLSAQLDIDISTLMRESNSLLAEGSSVNVVKLLKYYTAMCYVKSAKINVGRKFSLLDLGDPGPPHFMNQQNSFNSGMIKIILNLVSIPEQPGDVLAACFDCAKAHAVNYPDVQKELFESLDLILNVKSESNAKGELGSWQQSLGLCLSEIFNHCKDTCLGVRPQQVAKMLELLVEYNSDAPAFVDALVAVAKVEAFNLPLPRNQGLIIKCLMQYKDRVMVQAYIDDKSSDEVNKLRINCLQKHNTNDFMNTRAQRYHLALVNLLASMCEGENRQIEATCRSIFSLEELTETIESDFIPHINKGPYIKFLLWVYLNAGESKTSIGTDIIDSDPVLFKAMAVIGQEELVHYFDPKSQVFNQHAEFAFDMYIPCLLKLIDRHATAQHKTQVYECAVSLTVLITNLKKSGTAYMDKFRCFAFVNCLNEISDFLERYHMQQPKGFDVCKQWVSQQGLHLDAGVVVDPQLAAYTTKYCEEKKLNDELNLFMRLIYESYKGPNTIRDQLSSSTEETEVILNPTLPYAEDEEDDNYLPLGPEFQRLLKVFDDPKIDSKGESLSKSVMQLFVRLCVDALSYQATASGEDRASNDRVLTKLLQVVRAKCHNLEIVGKPTISLQKDIVKSNAVLAVSGLITSPRRGVRQESLALLSAILKDGFGDAQKAYTLYFLGTREEAFFSDITKLIRISSESILELRQLRRQKSMADERLVELRKTMTMTVNGQLKTAGLAKSLKSEASKHKMRANKVGPADSSDAQNVVQTDILFESSGDEINELQFKDPGNIRLVLQVIQSLCEGHNEILQDYMRTQPDNVVQYNLVSQTAKFLEVIREFASENEEIAKEILVQTLECLTELAQGNYANQKTIFDDRVTDQLNAIMRESLVQLDFGFGNDIMMNEEVNEDRILDWQVDAKCAQLLVAQIASNSEGTKVLAKELMKILDKRAVMQKIRYYLVVQCSAKESHDIKLAESAYWSPDTVSFMFFTVIKRLCDISHKEIYKDTGIIRSDLKQLAAFAVHNHISSSSIGKTLSTSPLDKVYGHFDATAKCIEILMNGELQKVHFYVPSAWNDQLQEEMKRSLLWTVDRTSNDDRVRDFSDRCKNIIADMKYMDKLMKNSVMTAAVIKYNSKLHTLVLFLTFILNLMVLGFWESSSDLDEHIPIYSVKRDAYNLAFAVLGVMHVIVSVLIVVAYFMVHPPSFRDVTFFNQFGERETDSDALTEELDDDDDQNPTADIKDDEVALDPRQERVFEIQNIIGRMQETDLIPESDHRTVTSPFAKMSVYYLVFTTMSVLGLFSWGYTFSFHLLHIIVGNQTLGRVIQSVTKNGITLLYVGLLLTVVIYIYSLIVFATLRSDIDSDAGFVCNTMFQCFLTSLKLGLLSGGGLADVIPTDVSEVGKSSTHVLIRFFFDLSFFIIVTLIGLNVVFGIIVDTFSELRDEKYEIQNAMNTECFICGRSSVDLDRKSDEGNFLHHVKHDHHMWNYLFFFYHLDSKDATEYNAIEQYVAEKFYTGDYDFYPIGCALSLQGSDALENGEDSRIDDLAVQVGELGRVQQAILERLDSLAPKSIRIQHKSSI